MAFNLFPQTDFRQMDLNYILDVSKQAAANLEEYAADKEQVVATQAAAERALAAAEDATDRAEEAEQSAGESAQSASDNAQLASQASETAVAAKVDIDTNIDTILNEAAIPIGIDFITTDRSLDHTTTPAGAISFGNTENVYTLDGIYNVTTANSYWWGLLSNPQITRTSALVTASSFQNLAKQIEVKHHHVYKIKVSLLSGSIVGDEVTIRAYDENNQMVLPDGVAINDEILYAPDEDKYINIVIRIGYNSGFSNASIRVDFSDVTNPRTGIHIYSTYDTTDRTHDIKTALTAYGVAVLHGGDYYTSGITMDDDTAIVGQGAPNLILASDANRSCISMKNRCRVIGINILGDLSNVTLDYSNITDRVGILFAGDDTSEGGPEFGIVDDCAILHFTGSGIRMRNTSYATKNCLTVSDSRIYNCCVGVHIVRKSEYSRFIGLLIGSCYYGIMNNGGNNTFMGCSINLCNIALKMGRNEGSYPNDGHGIINGCIFHHNTEKSIELDNIRYGFIISNCSIGSNIEIMNSDRFVFYGCRFGGAHFTVNGGDKVYVMCGLCTSADTINNPTLLNNGEIEFINTVTTS